MSYFISANTFIKQPVIHVCFLFITLLYQPTDGTIKHSSCHCCILEVHMVEGAKNQQQQ